MKINIQFVHIASSDTLEFYTINKLIKLGEKYNAIIHADVFFKKGNNPRHKEKICEIELSLAGPRLFASSAEDKYEIAVKETISALTKQLEKRKAEVLAAKH